MYFAPLCEMLVSLVMRMMLLCARHKESYAFVLWIVFVFLLSAFGNVVVLGENHRSKVTRQLACCEVLRSRLNRCIVPSLRTYFACWSCWRHRGGRHQCTSGYVGSQDNLVTWTSLTLLFIFKNRTLGTAWYSIHSYVKPMVSVNLSLHANL